MDSKRSTNQTGQARGNLMRQERQLSQAKMKLESATRNRIVGGVILVLGAIVLIQFSVAVGVVAMLIGGWVLFRAVKQWVKSAAQFIRLPAELRKPQPGWMTSRRNRLLRINELVPIRALPGPLECALQHCEWLEQRGYRIP